MTDREKLLKTSDIEKFIEERRYFIDRHVYSGEEKEGANHIIDCLWEWWEMFFESDWRPTSRPCFDKPAGVAILHRETV